MGSKDHPPHPELASRKPSQLNDRTKKSPHIHGSPCITQRYRNSNQSHQTRRWRHLHELIQRRAKSLPPETARCNRLFGLSTTARETWLQQPALLTIIHHFLRTTSKPYHWSEEGAGELVTDPILSAASTLDICPGVKAQGLHRDDFIWQQTHMVEQEEYLLGSDVGLGLLVAGVKTTAANGATMVRVVFFLFLSFLGDRAEVLPAMSRDHQEADGTCNHSLCLDLIYGRIPSSRGKSTRLRPRWILGRHSFS